MDALIHSGAAIHALWTFPAIILAALLIAWAAECGQFYISQGLALAVLAWVQTLPEFAVEAVIALGAAKDPSQMHLVTANFTGSLRLFVGFGWPMVYFVAVLWGKRPKGAQKRWWTIEMEDEHSIAVLSLLPALIYFLFIYLKGTLTVWDSVALGFIYFIYLFLLSRMPAQEQEGVEDLSRIPKAIMKAKPPANYFWILGFFVAGALILWFCAHPFLESMLGLAVSMGVSQFVFVQWMAPFLSEFPEKLSAFHWAKSGKAPMALVNFVSSSINQWTILVATVPVIYSFGVGHVAPIQFDSHQRLEILLTITQSYLGFLFLLGMDFAAVEAIGLFVLWLIQFLVPGVREEIVYFYALWIVVETTRFAWNYKKRNAFNVFGGLVREKLFKKR